MKAHEKKCDTCLHMGEETNPCDTCIIGQASIKHKDHWEPEPYLTDQGDDKEIFEQLERYELYEAAARLRELKLKLEAQGIKT